LREGSFLIEDEVLEIDAGGPEMSPRPASCVQEGEMQWEEIVAHLRGRYQVGSVTRTWVELWRSFRQGRSALRQQQTVRSFQQCGATYYAIEAEVGVPRHVRAALCETEQLSVGMLVDRPDALVAQTQLPASALTPETLDRLLFAIAHEAMRLSMAVWQRQRAESESDATKAA
jgi:hypothetical protein